ncbi:MAG: 5'-methylthioadenosine/adenosylhomocysteine nucleosidase [Spirochaetota bacterium]|nr:5'-methylthioadenosine/adenosylhomocysteine nucleosidase [Spirochaetota bacterium]
MIGIMSAISFEVSNTLFDKLINRETENRLGHDFHRGILAGHEVVITTTGIGKVRAAARTQYCIDHFDVEKLIFVGVAGALNPRLKVGDIVISQQVMQHDFALSADPKIENKGSHCYYGDSEMIQIVRDVGERLGYDDRLHFGKILTGDQVIHDQSKKERLHEELDGDCVEMEGAAVGMVCRMNMIPFVLLRGISDLANEQMIQDHLQSLPGLIEHNTQLLIELVENLP